MEMPPIGFGLWKVDPADCERVIIEAIQAGYRHFDCAADYGNEAAVGAALRKAFSEGLVSREEVWITSKLWNTYHAPEHVEEACLKSLADLGLDYLDLYLVHFPIALEHVPIAKRYPPEWIHDPDADKPVMRPAKVPLHETWAAMEQLTKKGLVREIGVCNYNSALLHDLMNYAQIAPAVLQVEMHPYLTQDKLLRLALQYGLRVTAFSPLGASSPCDLSMSDTFAAFAKCLKVNKKTEFRYINYGEVIKSSSKIQHKNVTLGKFLCTAPGMVRPLSSCPRARPQFMKPYASKEPAPRQIRGLWRVSS